MLHTALDGMGVPEEERALAYGPQGKPCLASRPDIYFNLSHCRGCAAALVTGAGPVGLDVEWIRPYHPAAAARILSPGEREALEASCDPDRTFFRLWTLKESYAKALGRGLNMPLKEVCFRLGENGAVLASPPEAIFRLIEDTPGFVTAACLMI